MDWYLSYQMYDYELFLIGQNLTYDRLNHLMTSNAKHFNNDDIAKMDTYNRILKEQQEKRIAQSIKDKAVIEAMFSNNNRPLNNNHELKKVEN